MEQIWEIVIHTPIWAYLLLIYLIFIGIKDTKARVIKLPRIFIGPTILSALSLHTLMTTVLEVSYLIIGSWILGVVFGSILGWWQVKRLKIQVDKKRLLIHAPGTWSSMCVLLTIFAARYYLGYEQATNPIITEQMGFKVSLFAAMGIGTGFFIGKSIRYISYFRNSSAIN